jgi:membrane protease YdiL (CAAX protease family)
MTDRYAYNPNAQQPQPAPLPPEIQETLNYKHSLRHDNMMIVLMLVAFYCVMMVLQSFLLFIPMLSSEQFANIISNYASSGGSQEDLYNQMINLMQSETLPWSIPAASIISEVVALPLFLVVRGKKMFTTDVISSNEKMRPATFAQIFVIALGAQFIFSVVANILDALLGNAGLSATDKYSSAMDSMMNLPGYIYVMLLGPIMEELVFRAAIMKKLERYGANFAIIMSSVFFACYHIFLVQALFAFPVGILLGYVAHKYSVKWSMLMHILYNSAAIIISAVLSNENLQFMVFATIFIVSLILLLLNRNTIREQIQSGKPERKGAFAIAFSGVFVIAFLVIVAFLSIILM